MTATITTVLLAGSVLLGLVPALPLTEAHASHSGDAPLLQVEGAGACDPHMVERRAPDLQSREAIVIVGDEGPTGFVLGHDPVTGEPIPRSGAGVTAGTGTAEDPYIIEGWLIEQAGNGISLRDTTAHVVIRENRLAHHASHAVSLDNVENVVVTRNVIETNVGSGVNVEGPAPGVAVTDNALSDNQRGLSAEETDGFVAARNAVFDNRGIGIDIDDSTGARIEGNVVDAPGDDGIRIEQSPQTALRCNRVVNGPATGIFLGEESTNSTIAGNRVDNHGHGILVSESSGTAVQTNHVTWSTGVGESTNIFVYESDGVVVSDNDVSVAQFGIVVRRSFDTRVDGNALTAHTWGIFCTGNIAGGTADSPEGAAGNELVANSLDDHQRSIVLRECDETTVAENQMTGQSADGIHDFEGRANTHRANTIEDAGRAGIYLWRDGGHEVVGNRIRHSEDGVRVLDSSDNHIRGNELDDNHHALIVRESSSANLIEGNHIVGSSGVGVYLWQGTDATVVTNGILHNAVGVVVGSGHPQVRVHDNNIRGNAQGLQAHGDEPVAATDNWWGCSEGPEHADCDSVHGHIDVEPWRTSPVDDVGRAPVIEPLDDALVSVGTTLELTVAAHHPDREPFTVRAEDLPDGASFDEETWAFTWTPGAEDVGTHVVTFTADDGTNRSEETLTILVAADAAGPVANDTTATVTRGSDVVIDVLANDEFPDAPADWSSLRLVTEPRGRHDVGVEHDADGYPTVRFSAGNSANDGTFDYEICDVEQRCASASVLVVVD